MRREEAGNSLNVSSRGHASATPVSGHCGALRALGTMMQLRAGKTLFFEADPADHVYQVIQGAACLYKLLPDGRRQVARFCHAGHLMGMTVSDRYPYTADALTNLSVTRGRRTHLEARLGGERALRQMVVDAVSIELSAAQEQLLLLGRKSAMERVASFLSVMREQAQLDGGDGWSVTLPMTRIDIADFLGLTHETVCRNMALLKAQGIISTPDPHRVVIHQPQTLEDIADGDTEQKLCA